MKDLKESTQWYRRFTEKRSYRTWVFLGLIGFFSLFFLSGCLGGNRADIKPAKSGVLDLRNMTLETGDMIDLRGEWHFFWKEFLVFEQWKKKKHRDTLFIPNYWTKSKKKGVTSTGFATFALTIHFPKNLHRFEEQIAVQVPNQRTANKLLIYNNQGKLLTKRLENGQVGKSNNKHRPSLLKRQIVVFLKGERTLHFIMHVSNYEHKGGGFYKALSIGHPDTLRSDVSMKQRVDFFVLGMIFFVGFYHVLLYLFRREETVHLAFALFTLTYGVRLSLTEGYLYEIAHNRELWAALIRLEYLTVYSSVVFGALYCHQLFPRKITNYFLQGIYVVSLGYAGLTMFAPLLLVTKSLVPFQLLMLFCCLYFGLFSAYDTIRSGSLVSILFIIGFFLSLLTIVNDILHQQYIIRTFYMGQYGILCFAAVQSVVLAVVNYRNRLKIEALSKMKEELSIAANRFVPKGLISALGKESVVEVQEGLFREQEMTIVCVGLRDYSHWTRDTKREDRFRLLSHYFSFVDVFVQKYNGFSHEYHDEVLMALFEDPAEGFYFAFELLNSMEQLNLRTDNKVLEKYELELGMCSGKVVIGTIGGRTKIGSKVIGAAIDLAERLKSVTKDCKCSLLASETTYNALQKQFQEALEPVKGQDVWHKGNLLSVYREKKSNQTGDATIVSPEYANTLEHPSSKDS